MPTLIIDRFDGQRHYQQQYMLAQEDVTGKTVLGVLLFIKHHLDASLNFTASCRCAICGACGVRVNGHAILACDTHIDDLFRLYATDTLTISPLANFPLISDLVVDWEPALGNLAVMRPNLVPKKPFSPEQGCTQTPEELEEILKDWDCILCGCCASECNKLTAGRHDYMEPSAYVHASRAAADSRGCEPMRHGKPAAHNGLWKCVHCQECADRCPKGISPAENIARLRGIAMRHGMCNGPGPRHARAFVSDLVEGSGRLNEIRMDLRTEGLAALGRVGMALTLLRKGKLRPASLLGEPPMEGHEQLRAMIDAARAQDKE